MFIIKKLKPNQIIMLIRDAALNRVIGLNTHLDYALVDLDRLKLVPFCVYNHVEMCRKQNKHCSPLVDSDRTVYNMENGKSSAGLFSPADDGISAE